MEFRIFTGKMTLDSSANFKETTIAAVSSGLTPSGIAVIRISGPEAVPAADRVFSGRVRLSEVPTHTVHYGRIVDRKATENVSDLPKDGKATEETVDEVLATVMRGPGSYTGEDVVEISCHGGLFAAKKILSLLFSSGAVPAEPGEFTKRAFLNGRMDLSQAEAVMDIIGAENDFALKAGVSGLRGDISRKIREIREGLLNEIAFIEAALDDPEHYDLSGYPERLSAALKPVEEALSELIRVSDYGSILAEGIKTVIAGRPNAGKSSLFNLLSGHEKAIVTEIPGTTRDVLETHVSFGPLSLILMDTAGLRDTGDQVERIGVQRAKEAIEAADLVLYVADSTEGLTEEDREALRECGSKPVILLMNKADLLAPDASLEPSSIRFSCLSGEGLRELEERVNALFDARKLTFNDEVVITNERQKALLRDALRSLRLVDQGISDQLSEEFLAADLTGAYSALSEILGEAVSDDVIDRVFEKFCMGK